MKVEFTKKLSSNNWSPIRIAVNERADNLIIDTPEKERLLRTILTRPELVIRFEEYGILHEMAAQTKKLWKPNENLTIYFFGGQNKRTQRVLEYASEWSNYCSIKFEPTSIVSKAKLRVAFQPPGSWSYIGTDALGISINEPTINFGWLDSVLPEREYRYVVLHEFGHALGLIHEHQSPASQMDWNKPVVYDYFQLHYHWSKDDVDINIFQAFENESTQYSTLDRQSIMAYYIPPQFTLNHQEFPQNFVLSDMDKNYIGQIYPKVLTS